MMIWLMDKLENINKQIAKIYIGTQGKKYDDIQKGGRRNFMGRW